MLKLAGELWGENVKTSWYFRPYNSPANFIIRQKGEISFSSHLRKTKKILPEIRREL